MPQAVVFMKGMDDMGKKLKEIHFRISEDELCRIEKLKEEFKFKSRARLCRILLSCSADNMEKHICFANAEQGQEIHDTIFDIAHDIQFVKRQLERMWSSIFRMTDIIYPLKKYAPKPFEIHMAKSIVEAGSEYERMMKKSAEEYIQKYAQAYESTDEKLAEMYKCYIESECENAAEILEAIHHNLQMEQVDINQVSDAVNFDFEGMKELIAKMDEASERLGKILWAMK